MTLRQTLTLAEVKAACRRYYDMSKLIAQHPKPRKRRLVFVSPDGYRCAVGAALSDETIAKGIITLGDYVINVDILYADNESKIGSIMLTHDSWASATEPHIREYYEREFLRMIEYEKNTGPEVQ